MRCSGVAVHVEPRALDLLCHLVEHRDRVVPKNELLDLVWGDRFVSEGALTTALRTARLAVGDSGASQRMIRTAHRRGYQFVGTVVAGHAGESGVPEPAAVRESQAIRFSNAADATRITYATVGSGEPLLKAANWMTHLGVSQGGAVAIAYAVRRPERVSRLILAGVRRDRRVRRRA
ncbi:winged helix-turn-helix domain-containing protein [Actinoplanes solisilvae]|uniref:winged helix-turn-helix domain-containing protein n=1 Tax=Actinoplanes solisilvae TaxID=2486853 RepID=UPI002103D1A7|nr:winged helix-turn-helix domain-containing protein [Actinoplanes solisilvae]